METKEKDLLFQIGRGEGKRKLRENFEAKERKLREPDSTIFDII